MNRFIEDQLTYFITDKKHHQFRTVDLDPQQVATEFAAASLDDLTRAARRFAFVLDQEIPVVLANDKIAILRTVKHIPEIFTIAEWAAIKKSYTVHEQGKVCNINPDYAKLLAVGTEIKRQEIQTQLSLFQNDPEKSHYLLTLLVVLDALENFADKYRAEAIRVGNLSVAAVFERIPRARPQTFQEALQFLRLLHFGLWSSFNYHNTLGRFDQYMYAYFQHDLDTGILNRETALELLEAFFISCNKDSDLYPGMQQGDNGQSLVLGGLNPDGTQSYNDLSDLCLQASLELKLIDPKINLRVNKKTPVALYDKGSELTRQGLGFPQYSNDDIVIQALKNWGYADQDAHNYVVAACWEFIVPGTGMDIPNINALSFTHVIDHAIRQTESWTTFDDLMATVQDNIKSEARRLMASTTNIYMEPAPLMSLMMDGCVEQVRDISRGGRYNNYGFHGTGLSTAVDSLAVIQKYLFEEKRFTKDELITMLDRNFEGQDELLSVLRYQSPKMGNDDDQVDDLAVKLLNWFADSLEGHTNDRGGIYRAGTGSAMYYIWHAQDEPATPDGRKRGEPLACNYSPSLFSRTSGPISIIKSFTKPDLTRVANGGPLTIELHDTMFRNSDSVHKVGQYVKSFIDMGGHQMQINAVNREKMIAAKADPDHYRNLIVRVWGWSGYFVELDEVYQDHIIERMELNLG
ncbi:MAG: pyruvate formate lyase family protein [Eubacteriales bacterium]|nr:pyruvate formate lyase family protein [Eubacteriales bacterium]